MSDLQSHAGDGAPTGASDAVLIDAHRWATLQEELASIRRLLRQRSPQIPETHKYSLSEQTAMWEGKKMSYCEVGIRLVCGYRPEDLAEDELFTQAKRAPSRRTIHRLLADEDGVLKKVKIGGQSYVTERSIRHYEQGINEGWVEGYQVLDAMKR